MLAGVRTLQDALTATVDTGHRFLPVLRAGCGAPARERLSNARRRSRSTPLGGPGPSERAAPYDGPPGPLLPGAAQRNGGGAGALQPAHDLAQRGGVEGAGEVADGLVVVVGEGVDAGAVEGGVEGLGCGAGEAAVGEVGGLSGLVGGLAGTVGDVLPVVLTAQRVLEGGVVVGVVALGACWRAVSWSGS
ncbi:hypothetical protein GCM10010502_73640 [Kitasatospora aureofaciens]|uniref:Uncharacterized protein n=1 Tax=Kitasatospora aureofaciens TaxID=1894 RepID=A0A8H9I116_KITAU|nr:hypothetical protein GCM10010502_73640 [Kitasatospora aureofaciens]